MTVLDRNEPVPDRPGWFFGSIAHGMEDSAYTDVTLYHTTDGHAPDDSAQFTSHTFRLGEKVVDREVLDERAQWHIDHIWRSR